MSPPERVAVTAGTVELLDRPTETVTFDTYDAIREALFNRDLSRSFDKRSYEAGNVRDGVVSIVHGATHRARRRVENTEFRPDRLRLYERELFPAVLARLLDRLATGDVDLFVLGEIGSVTLAGRRAGSDHGPGSPGGAPPRSRIPRRAWCARRFRRRLPPGEADPRRARSGRGPGDGAPGLGG